MENLKPVLYFFVILVLISIQYTLNKILMEIRRIKFDSKSLDLRRKEQVKSKVLFSEEVIKKELVKLLNLLKKI